MATTTSAGTRSEPGKLVLRVTGYVLVWVGGTVLLYLVYVLWFTGVATERAQERLLDQFEDASAAQSVTTPPAADDDPVVADDRDDAGDAQDRAVLPDIGTGVAVIEFERPGTSDAPVADQPYVVVEGTTHDALAAGPGRYVSTAQPGQPGNLAVAGHRTTYGAPFFHLDQLRPGDLVHVTDRAGVRHTYEIIDGSSGGGAPGQHIVLPTATWVLEPDPLDTGGAVLTLTTCHPRWSAAQRMVVFGQLVDSVAT